MIYSELETRIIEEFSSKWELNDPAHRLSHFKSVQSCGVYINATLKLNYDVNLITMVAYFHDLFAWSRDNHHEMSAFWIMTTDHPLVNWMDSTQRKLVSNACKEHRASYKGVYSHEFSELMASADRGEPGNIEDMLIRAVQFRTSKGMGYKEAHEGALLHLKEKYGSNGYARYPRMYQETFKDILDRQRIFIDEM